MRVVEFSKEYKVSSRTIYHYLKTGKCENLIQKKYIRKKENKERTFWFIENPHALYLYLCKNTEMFKK